MCRQGRKALSQPAETNQRQAGEKKANFKHIMLCSFSLLLLLQTVSITSFCDLLFIDWGTTVLLLLSIT